MSKPRIRQDPTSGAWSLVDERRPAAASVPTAADESGGFVRTEDAYSNPATRTGITEFNLSSAGRAILTPVTRNRLELEWLYRGNWVARILVDAMAEDMTRAGVTVQSKDDASDLEKLNKAAERLRIWTQLGRCLKWANLYGGSLGYLMIDGQDAATELDLDTIKPGQFKGILPLDRWMVWPETTDIISDLVPDYGLPRYYTLWAGSIFGAKTTIKKIHYSRLIKFDGLELPQILRQQENYWGASVLEPLYDRILAFDSATQGAAQLVYKAHLRTIKIKGLRQLLGGNAVAAASLEKFLGSIRVHQSTEGMTVLDTEDEFDVQAYNFAGIPDIILQFAQQISGGGGIPMVRFYGQSPAGLNSTGESDWRNYYDNVTAKQERVLRPGVETVWALLYRSELERKPKDVYTINFKSLWGLDEKESAEVTSAVTTAVGTLVDKQIYGRADALKELRTLTDVTGFGSNITDDMIEQAEEDDKFARENPPDPNDLEGGGSADPGDTNVRRFAPSGARTQSGEDPAGDKNVRNAA